MILDRQYLAGAAVLNDLSDGGLCAHGVDGDGVTGQLHSREQLRNAREFRWPFRLP